MVYALDFLTAYHKRFPRGAKPQPLTPDEDRMIAEVMLAKAQEVESTE
jgi:hypothetical protein